jgi:hypothetical protein
MPIDQDKLRKAHQEMFERYLRLLNVTPQKSDKFPTYDGHLAWMCKQMVMNLDEPEYPIDKAARWLGYIQGVMVMKKHIDVNVERDFSRPLFQAAYGFDPNQSYETPENDRSNLSL